MKPEPLPKFIARMKGREFTAGDVEANCKIPVDDAAQELRRLSSFGRVARVDRTANNSHAIWRAI